MKAKILELDKKLKRTASIKESVRTIPIDSIIPDPKQPRKTIDERALKELSDSIAINGLLQPIGVRPENEQDQHLIVWGERRWRAAQMAGLKSIDAVIRDIEQEKTLLLQFIENRHRADVSPFEEAEALQLMLQLPSVKNKGDLAKFVGKSNAFISQRLNLLKVPTLARKLYEKGQLQDTEALILLGKLYGFDRDLAEALMSEPNSITRESLREALSHVKKEPRKREAGNNQRLKLKQIQSGEFLAAKSSNPCQRKGTDSAEQYQNKAPLIRVTDRNFWDAHLLSKSAPEGHVWVIHEGKEQLIDCKATTIILLGY